MAAIAMMSVVFAAGAMGHGVKFDTSVTVKFQKAGKSTDPYAKPALFDGTVSSSKARCEKKRKVSLRMRESDGSTSVVSTDNTDATGAWEIQPSGTVAPGDYFVKVSKKVLRKSSKHRHVCKKAVSKDVKVK